MPPNNLSAAALKTLASEDIAERSHIIDALSSLEEIRDDGFSPTARCVGDSDDTSSCGSLLRSYFKHSSRPDASHDVVWRKRLYQGSDRK